MDNDIQISLSKMREDFIARLPSRLIIFKTLLSDLECGRSESIAALYRESHSLVGAAGVHGLVLVSEAARALEQIVAAMPVDGILDEQGLDAIREALASLEAQTVNPSSSFVPHVRRGPTKIPHIVVVDDDKEQTDWLRSVLEQAGYRIDVFHKLADFSAASLTFEPPSAVIIDMMFPEGDDAGARAIAKLKEQCLNSFPVIFISVRQDMAAKLAAYRAGATCYLTKPVNRDALLRVVADSAALMPRVPFRVLLVDDDPEQLMTQGQTLRQSGMTVLESADPLKVLEMLESFAAEVLVLDMYMPECSGPELAAILRDDERYAQMPIVYLSAETSVSKQLLALNRGGDHFLTKPVDPRHLVAAVALQARRFRQTREQAESLRATLYERERQQQALDAHAIVSATDMAGVIIYVNERFCEISGYSRNEVLGENHRIVKSSEHPPEFYRDIWFTITQGNIWRGEVCNRRKDGSLYWVETSIVPFLDKAGWPYQYVSIRTDITRIKEAELRLRLLERAVEASTSSISMAYAGKPDMPLIYVNPAFERITGYSRDEVIGRNCRFLQGEEVGQPSLDEIRAALRAGRAGEALVHNYRKDGTPFWNDLRIAPVHDEQGRLTHFIGISDDVTKRREAEDALLQSEERLRRSQLYANIGTWDWNIQTGQLLWSERIPPLFGCPEDKQEKHTYEEFLDAVHPDDRQKVIDAVNDCVELGFEYNIEHRCVWPDGTVHWLMERGDVVRDADGTPLNMLGVVQDITKRKFAELALAESRIRLEESQNLAKLGNWEADLSTGEMRWADEIYRIFGQDPATYTPSVEGFLDAVHPDDIALVRESERYAAETGIHSMFHRIIRPDGEVRYVHELARLERNAEGRLVCLIGTVQDVTELKLAEQALINSRDEAERANSAKSDFLSSMSHELRTPMNAILGFGQLLEIDGALNEEQKDYVDEILKAGRHLLELINEVLDLAKIESGKINLSLELLHSTELITECVALVKPIAQVQGITIDDAPIDDYVIRADRTRLKQVLINLLSNAIKYNRPQGEVSIQVTIRDGWVRLAVSDTGYGIAETRQQEVFQPFSRLGAEETDIEGTGIGLTISRRLTEMMGGNIDMESKVGRGSIFWIELPEATSGRIAESNDLKQAMTAGTIFTDECRYTMLYIEDNPANLRLVSQILDRIPQLQLITAHNPELGLELASVHHPDLILLDINLPGMDGYQVLSILRSMDSVKNMPVIAISANATSRDIERGIAAGFNDYITKPVNIRHFLETVSRLLPYDHKKKP
ncbi:response regulator [Methylobacter sp.]|uniref:response regulator n=1 Tax=Methylobacter sp. TaxID=2051955 RepID=UPI0011F8BBB0|nr:response regulator [Methylobacter sp.]TAK63291.1 MAG: response regulator [Methylobacter sp.]